MSNITKSKERVKKHAEVFTPIHIVKKMTDLVEQEESDKDVWAIGKTWMESACGNGVFIGEIVKRKLSRCETVDQGLKALCDVYAIDIQADNIQQAQCQVLGQFVQWCVIHDFIVDKAKLDVACHVIKKNVIVGDFLKPETIMIYDWKAGREITLSECMS